MLVEEIVTEKKKKKSKAKRKYGGYWYPGFSFTSDSAGSEGGGDGGGGGEGMHESKDVSTEVEKFKDWAVNILKIQKPIKIDLSNDTEEAQENHHTGGHIIGDDTIWVYAKNRNLVDILRTVFHELVHVRQGELGMVGNKDSYPGSPIEAQADMLAGKFIKIYGKKHRNIFQ